MSGEHVVLDRVELVRDLVEDRKAVVEKIVEHLVEQAARPFREELSAELRVLGAALEEARHRQQLDARQRNEVVGPEEEVELRRVQALDRLVVDGEVQDGEEILRIVVDLRPLASREHVLDVQRVPVESLRERLRLLELRRVELDPGQAVFVKLSQAGAGASDGLRGRRARWCSPDARQAWHRY